MYEHNVLREHKLHQGSAMSPYGVWAYINALSPRAAAVSSSGDWQYVV